MQQHDDDIYQIAPPETPTGPVRPPVRKLYQAQADARSSKVKKNIEAIPCPKCGYDLRGTPMAVCPECGLKITSRMLREAREGKKSFFRELYLKPLIILAIGLGISAFVSVRTEGAIGLVALAIGFTVTIAIGWVVFFVLSVTWIGMDQPLVTSMVQLAGAYAGTFAVSSVLNALPIGFAAFLLPLFVLVLLLSYLLDIERVEAWVVALVSWAAIIALEITIYALFG